ncbi:MAG: hypothetical protein R3F13_07665 [Prosthecobacter sp.]
MAADIQADSFVPGSIWANDQGRLRLTVHERQGETFTASFDLGKYGLRDVKGTVKGKLIYWYAKDVTVRKGKAGDDNFGTLDGDSIHFVYKAPGTSKELGTFILKRSGTSTPRSAPPNLPAPISISTIKTDSTQPLIEVIKDQGPNATEWALTPLDETIPADIRQNLTFLREDLLDEGAKTARSKPEAYKLASDYCGKLLAALDQRELARVNAGYRAAQADANKATSTQALNARRNYQMSWPQYAREESQRAALRESETDKADVKKERLKVEWATRATSMRSYLDSIYAQFREALRQSPPVK